MASCNHTTIPSPGQRFCCILVVFFPPDAIVPLLSLHAFQRCGRVSRERKLFHANALFSRLSLRGRTNEAYVDIEVGLGNPTDLIDGAAD